MTTSEEVMRRIFQQIVVEGNLDLVDELLHENYVEHPEDVPGRQAWKDRIAMFRRAFPDLSVTIDEMVVDGDRVATRTTIRGTHKEDLMGIPTTGRAVEVTGVDITHLRDGQAVERWGGIDMFGLLHQLGAIPSPA
jgi:steroid delta-isomerase-like uncharacterized protein